MKTNSPASTYRIQFHKEFSFDLFERFITYFQKLGVQTIYASPVFRSVPGSNHGYDGLNPLEINPEIGALEQFRHISAQLKQNGIGWLQDIVPNHMAFHPENKWLMDVLEKGNRSRYYAFFDIDWQSEVCKGKLMVPFLGTTQEEALQNGEIRIAYESKRFKIKYFETAYPLNAHAYAMILGTSDDEHLVALISRIQKLDSIDDCGKYEKAWERILSTLSSKSLKSSIDQAVEKVNANKALLARAIHEQFYGLCSWKETDKKINYRRFFTVNSLICINIQDENVFKKYHELIHSLVIDGSFNGLRVDHIDGLYDPPGYLQRLKHLTGKKTYIIVEKILQAGENLPVQWKTEGTTGYDFLSLVNNLFTSQEAEQLFTDFYEKLLGECPPVEAQLVGKKEHILYQHMAGELDNLYKLLMSFIEKELPSSVYPGDIKEAIGEFLVHCPVYRYYIDNIPLSELESTQIENIFSAIRKNGKASKTAIDFLYKVFLKTPREASQEYKDQLLHFIRRCMQFTGPLMAKGFEDTLMYTYNRFIVHNDVGDSPGSFGISKDYFDNAMTLRQKKWPLALNATSTHDTKRGEDARARLNVLSDLSEEWFVHVRRWQEENLFLRPKNIPDANEEYFIYQSLIGSYPMPEEGDEGFNERFIEYLQKSLREGKIHSDWADPDEEYEKIIGDFIAKLLDKKRSFWKTFEPFHKKVADFGIFNSLAQLILKFTCPGIPDVYQGCELWDFSFVDPDNRRPVDYEHRMQLLDELDEEKNNELLFQMLWKKRNGGQIKLWLTRHLFRLRKQHQEFFERAEYIPLLIKGEYAKHVFAFARKLGQEWLIVAMPLHTAALCKQQNADTFFDIDWRDTVVILPGRLKRKAGNILFGDETESRRKFSAKKLFEKLPFALLRIETEENVRTAAVRLHTTSI